MPPVGFEPHNLSRRAAADLLLRPCDHRDRQLDILVLLNPEIIKEGKIIPLSAVVITDTTMFSTHKVCFPPTYFSYDSHN